MRLAACVVRIGALGVVLGISAAVVGAGVASADTGVVRDFNPKQGSGFITPDDGSRDLFFGETAYVTGAPRPSVGQKVQFEVEPGYKWPTAIQISPDPRAVVEMVAISPDPQAVIRKTVVRRNLGASPASAKPSPRHN
jgi:CspA family cold shock protein